MYDNWRGEIYAVRGWTYDFSKTDEKGDLWGGKDFTSQIIPIRDGEEEF